MYKLFNLKMSNAKRVMKRANMPWHAVDVMCRKSLDLVHRSV